VPVAKGSDAERKNDTGSLKVLKDPGETEGGTGQPVNLEHEQHVEPAVTGIGKRLLKRGTVERLAAHHSKPRNPAANDQTIRRAGAGGPGE
jgi:hypothetical protein